MGGSGSFLGFATSCDSTLADGGVTRTFEGGSMYVAPGQTTAFALITPLRDYWLSLGGTTGQLGYPTTNAVPNPNGDGSWSAAFQHGQSSWSPATGGSNCVGLACNVIIFKPSFPVFIINP
jgi:uncharacterized protein with LGFP repeats